MQLRVSTGFVVMAALCVSFGCGKEEAGPADGGSAGSGEARIGTVNGDVYHNDRFGLSAIYPKGWNVESRNADEFIISKHPIGADPEANPRFTGSLQDLARLPDVTSGADYVAQQLNALKSGLRGVTLLGEIESVMIGGRSFSMMRFDIQGFGTTVHQKLYAFVEEGKVLSLSLAYASSEQESALDAILATVEFD